MQHKHDLIYVRSRCCTATWVLKYDVLKDKYELVCDRCGKSAGSEIKISGPQLDGVCEKCEGMC